MAFICIKGARECTACRACYGVSVCDKCGALLRDGMKIYEDSDTVLCRECAELLSGKGHGLSEKIKDYI